MDTTFNDASKKAVVAGLSMIPDAGVPISVVVDILWPDSKENIWAELKAQVEALINQKLAEYEYQQICEDLAGLKGVIDDYVTIRNDNKDNSCIKADFIAAMNAFDIYKPHFMSKGYEVLLLPLLAQMANLHLFLLRDGAILGKGWGLDDSLVLSIKEKLKQQIDEYVNYATIWYKKGYDNLDLPKKGHNLSTRRWKAQNTYVREMTFNVLDSAFYWPCFDPDAYPIGKALPKLTREIYSDPQGTSDDNPIGVNPPPVQSITNLDVWGWDRIDAVRVAYGGQWGPRMGDDSGGSDQPSGGWNGAIAPDNPITVAAGLSGDIINAMWFTFKNGTRTNRCGGNYQGGDPFTWSFDDHILSSIKIMGKSNFYHSADCVIFGFRYEDSY